MRCTFSIAWMVLFVKKTRQGLVRPLDTLCRPAQSDERTVYSPGYRSLLRYLPPLPDEKREQRDCGCTPSMTGAWRTCPCVLPDGRYCSQSGVHHGLTDLAHPSERDPGALLS